MCGILKNKKSTEKIVRVAEKKTVSCEKICDRCDARGTRQAWHGMFGNEDWIYKSKWHAAWNTESPSPYASPSAMTPARKNTNATFLPHSPSRRAQQDIESKHDEMLENEKLKHQCKWHTCSENIPSTPSPHARAPTRKIDKRHLIPHSAVAMSRFGALQSENIFDKNVKHENWK